ncbi:uncharacterized protein LOC128827955 [Malaclemys terrapin pileata]|uniref:uncharacterized protein LOC128827955 n=1 Tax=Malaclemys terrapin pileata TaxID=2991368 RepID=UPI0023A8BD6D|nr:uncharacterized protein LOC128827955 [Malaclemys terrapin pileata]
MGDRAGEVRSLSSAAIQQRPRTTATAHAEHPGPPVSTDPRAKPLDDLGGPPAPLLHALPSPQLTAPGERAKRRLSVHGTCIPSRVSSPGSEALSLMQGTACALEGQVTPRCLCQAKEFLLPQQQSQAAGTARVEWVLDSDSPPRSLPRAPGQQCSFLRGSSPTPRSRAASSSPSHTDGAISEETARDHCASVQTPHSPDLQYQRPYCPLWRHLPGGNSNPLESSS